MIAALYLSFFDTYDARIAAYPVDTANCLDCLYLVIVGVACCDGTVGIARLCGAVIVLEVYAVGAAIDIVFRCALYCAPTEVGFAA